MVDIISLVRLAKSREASDLHLSVNKPPVLRINGVLSPIEEAGAITPDDADRIFQQITTDREKQQFKEELELDFGYTFPEIVRVRCNVARQRGLISLAMRLIPTAVPTVEELHLPDICKDFALKPRGMIIVSGPTGSGKSTTLAAMINYLNRNRTCRVVTIEDPIEYIYSDAECNIIQRELGDDTLSFSNALKHVLRQDPDVILVGEMRDLETASAALNIAETGHMVLTTGHAPSASQAVERITDLFPPHERNLAQMRLASLLNGILCQTLVPRADGNGRIPAVEVMIANTAVKNLIREGKVHQLPNVIRNNSEGGMRLMDHALVDLYLKGEITGKSLLAFCNDRTEVEKLCGEIKVSLPESEPSLLNYQEQTEENPSLTKTEAVSLS